MEKESDKLEALSERIRKAEVGAGGQKVPEAEQGSKRNAGLDFAGVLVGSGIIGFLLDRQFGSTPWCFIGMIFFGFVAGVYTAWNAMNSSEDKDGK